MRKRLQKATRKLIDRARRFAVRVHGIVMSRMEQRRLERLSRMLGNEFLRTGKNSFTVTTTMAIGHVTYRVTLIEAERAHNTGITGRKERSG